MLRDSARDFPAYQPAIHARMKQLFATLLGDKRTDALPPLEFVTLVDGNADLLPDGPAGEALSNGWRTGCWRWTCRNRRRCCWKS